MAVREQNDCKFSTAPRFEASCSFLNLPGYPAPDAPFLSVSVLMMPPRPADVEVQGDTASLPPYSLHDPHPPDRPAGCSAEHPAQAQVHFVDKQTAAMQCRVEDIASSHVAIPAFGGVLSAQESCFDRAV